MKEQEQKNKKEVIFEWHYKQIDLENIKRTLNSRKKNTFFSNTHGTFCRVDHMLGLK